MQKGAKIALVVVLAVLIIAGLVVLAKAQKAGGTGTGFLSNLFGKPKVINNPTYTGTGPGATGYRPPASPAPYPPGSAWYQPPQGYNASNQGNGGYNNALETASYITAAGSFLSGLISKLDFGGHDSGPTGSGQGKEDPFGNLSGSGTLPAIDYSGAAPLYDGYYNNQDLLGLYGGGADPTGSGYGLADLWSGLDNMGGSYLDGGGLFDGFGGLGSSGGNLGAADQLRFL